ncbi:hypothetical protein AK830_g3238 [Neonectria ditissima]|uniref:Ecp2 effector protein-like domain-containing protein n=1 Tax=Neonectria ditissima TaxID=78410 RepID=A0A0P7BQV0_9HYPO|nr:hypothetical protein AK830_g3238 [Neonectria ditissima]
MRSLAVLATLLFAGLAAAAPATSSKGVTSDDSGNSDNLIVVSTVLACAATTTSSVPATTSTAASAAVTPITWMPTAHHQKACDEASFANESSEDPVTPADWRDCAALYSEWTSYNGTFSVGHANASAAGYGAPPSYDYPAAAAASKRAAKTNSNAGYIPIVQSGSCTLALKPGSLNQLLAVGDVDIAEILQNALNEHSSGTLLGARGDVNCAVRGLDKSVKAAVGWQLYYPGA